LFTVWEKWHTEKKNIGLFIRNGIILNHGIICPRLYFAVSIILIVLSSCSSEVKRNNSHPGISNRSILAGKKLAVQYCQSCHLLPDPALLDSKSWEKGVLPHMGPLLGIYEFNYQRYPANIGDRNLPPGFYPRNAALSRQEWQNLINYYAATSPDTLSPEAGRQPFIDSLPDFLVKAPALKFQAPSVSSLAIDPGSANPLLAVDIYKQTLFRFDKHLKLVDTLFSSGAIVAMEREKDRWLTCNIGIFNPTNEKYGEARYIEINSNGKMKKSSSPLFSQLTRPVHINPADLNNDGRKDYIVCEFGYLVGALSWMENLGDGKFGRHVLRPVPGAIRSFVQDYNHDGLPDIWVLFSQGDEGIFLFTNRGGGQFEEKEVLRFPPSYGSSYFEFADFNKDGFPDILYTCGDNADYSNVFKPYHGLYIFLNDGKYHFNKKYFFHLNGCYKALARDFDNDGDLDIASISYFADFITRPQEGFVYLKNNGNFQFQAYTSRETIQGRWITMEAGDLDGDGKTDLVLGNFSQGPIMVKPRVDWKKGPPFLFLRNISE
jgi:hypothetical protein